MFSVMAKKNSITNESIHERISRMRKEFGYTQLEIAEKLEIPQSVVSAYESGGRRFHAEVIANFAELFGVSTDELLGIEKPTQNSQRISVPLVKRMQKIQALPKTSQKVLLQTIDLFLKGAEK